MKTVYAVFAVAAVIVGLIGTATLLVLLMASAANSKPHQLRVIKWTTLASAVGGLAFAAGGVWLLTVGRPGWSIFAGVFSVIFFFGLIAWVSIKK